MVLEHIFLTGHFAIPRVIRPYQGTKQVPHIQEGGGWGKEDRKWQWNKRMEEEEEEEKGQDTQLQ